jgi:predicted secreted protein
MQFKTLMAPLAAALLLLGAAGSAAAQAAKPSSTTIGFAVEAQRSAPNDLARASAYAEATGTTPAEVARRVNTAIAAGLATAKAYPNVKSRSGPVSTYPIYGKSGRAIESWRMRAEILLETRDVAALSELLGKLQSTLAVGNLQLLPAPETLAKAEQDATLDAIGAFRARAKVIADAFGKPYWIGQMNIQGGGRPPIMPVAKFAMAAEQAVAAPIEAGESQVSVSISGQIELPAD